MLKGSPFAASQTTISHLCSPSCTYSYLALWPFLFINCFLSGDVLQQGLLFVGYGEGSIARMSLNAKHEAFKAHYGSNSLVLSIIWYDLQNTTIPLAALNAEENSEKGFKMFMITHFYLFTNPKNTFLLVSRFQMNRTYLQGSRLWTWVNKLAALRAAKIKWNPRFADDDFPIFICSIDGVDFKTVEISNDQYNVDRTRKSQKYEHAALRYLIAVDLHSSDIVFLDGPVLPGATNDLAHFRAGRDQNLVELIPPGKAVIVDRGYNPPQSKREFKSRARARHESLTARMKLSRNPPGKMIIADKGYRTSSPGEVGMIAVPDPRDPHSLQRYKSRSRSRQESLNARIKQFKICQDTFKYPDELKHKAVVEAVAVIVQYQMENGIPLFSVNPHDDLDL